MTSSSLNTPALLIRQCSLQVGGSAARSAAGRSERRLSRLAGQPWLAHPALPCCAPAVKVALQVAAQVLPESPRLAQGGHVVAVAKHRRVARVAAQLAQRALHLAACPACRGPARRGRAWQSCPRPARATVWPALMQCCTPRTSPTCPHHAPTPWRPAALAAQRYACQCRCRAEPRGQVRWKTCEWHVQRMVTGSSEERMAARAASMHKRAVCAGFLASLTRWIL